MLDAVGVDVVGVVVPEGEVREREAVAECDAAAGFVAVEARGKRGVMERVIAWTLFNQIYQPLCTLYSDWGEVPVKRPCENEIVICG